MKLYTEEQLLKAMNDYANTSSDLDYVMDVEMAIIEQLTPIELPSDRDIEIAANGNQEHYEGAMWLKHKYLTKTNKIK
jgi:hypothetical protein